MSLYAIILSIVLVSAAVILYLKAYRLLRGGKIRETNSQYDSPTPMLWERGHWLIKLHSRISGSTKLGRRGFLSRLALGFLCAITARAAARGSGLPAVEDFLTTQPWLDDAENTAASLEQCSHSDLTINHIDVYGPGGSHMDRAPSHNDHTDCPPHTDQPPHNDQPPPHTDKPHVDTPHGDHGDVVVR